MAPSAYQDWLAALMAIYHETGGSTAGLDLADSWSRKGSSYKGRSEIEAKWKSFSGNVSQPITVATLIAKARAAGADTASIMGEDFEPCLTEVVEAAPEPTKPTKASPFERFSLIGQAAKYIEMAQTVTPLLGEVCQSGEATIWYAKHNTGKTLLTLHLIAEAVEQGRIAAGKVFYINADDSSAGLADKLVLLDELKAHTLVPGQKGFKAESLEELLAQAVQDDTARGTLVIIDTMKKFVDLMSKRQASDFAGVCRQFVAAGGTLLGLAHVNKRRSEDGKVIHAGTSDILDDFDAGYLIDEVPSGSPGIRVVEFSRMKSRGGGVQSVAYGYTCEDGVSYSERLASVAIVDPNEVEDFKRIEAERADSDVIPIVNRCIEAGSNTKIALSKAVALEANISRRNAVKLIERYTGNDPAQHHWRFTRKARGAMVYEPLAKVTIDRTEPEASTPSG